MARLPRLVVPGQAHLVVHRAHGSHVLFSDDEDRVLALQCLRDAMAGRQVVLHAYALLLDSVWMLLMPGQAGELGRMLQSFGRRYTATFNRRHGGRGTVWASRYRCTVVEPGPTMRDVLLFVDQTPVHAGLAGAAGEWVWSSARHHLGTVQDPAIADAAEYWALGNTPFDRAAVYAALVAELLPPARAADIAAAAEKGWAIGSAAYLSRLGEVTVRPLSPRPRGRPRSAVRDMSVPK